MRDSNSCLKQEKNSLINSSENQSPTLNQKTSAILHDLIKARLKNAAIACKYWIAAHYPSESDPWYDDEGGSML